MSFDTKNSLLPPNLLGIKNYNEVFVSKSARVNLNGYTHSEGYSGAISITGGEEPSVIQVNTDDVVVLRFEKRFPPYQIITGK